MDHIGADPRVGPVAWRFCAHCGERIVLDFYPYNYCSDYRDDIRRELDNLEYEHECTTVPAAPPAR